MSVGRDEARRIAELARLRLAGAELERLTGDLNGILAHVDALRTLDLARESDLTPQVRGEQPSTRAEGEDDPDALVRGPQDFAPAVSERFFVVPPLPGLGSES